MSADIHIVYGQGVAQKFFARRGNHSEAHLSQIEVAAIAAIGYLDGMRDSGRDELLAALHRLKTEFGKLANELHNAKGLYTAGEIKSIAGEMIRLFEPAHAAIAKAEGQS